MGGVGSSGPKYVQMQSEADYTTMASSFYSFHQHNFQGGEPARIFHELPKAMIIQVSRPDAGDISPMQLTYTIEFQYKQVRSQFRIVICYDLDGVSGDEICWVCSSSRKIVGYSDSTN